MKTGLVLAGGGSRGSYQLGAWKALRELGICPDIITGTSVGALNGALMIQDTYDTATNLWEQLDTTTVFDFPKEPNFLEYAKAFFHQGGIRRSRLEQLIKTHLQEDKIRASRIPLGMVLVRKKDLSAHRVFTEDVPQGMLRDYLMATSACFPAARCHTISGVDYIDGGYCDNLPISLAKQKGADRIIAVCLDEWGTQKTPFAQDASVISIYPKWNLGNWLIFRKENTGRNIRLGYLDTMKAFGVFEGDAFTFRKNTFRILRQQKQLSLARWSCLLKQRTCKEIQKLFPENANTEDILKIAAELTGKLLRISPYCVYTQHSFLSALRRKKSCPKREDFFQKSPSPFELAKSFLLQPKQVFSVASRYPKETVAGIFLSIFLA